jgi:hypothetical protein
LFAARNEFVSFQVGLHGGEAGWRGVSASLPALDGPVRIEGADIVLYREVLLPISRPTLPYSERGGWPDGLVPDVDETVGERRRAFPLDVPARESRAVWVDVHVPMDAPPGEYHGTVEVWGEGYQTQVSVALTVVDWVMPSTSSLRTSFLLWTPSACMAFTGKRDCSREEQLRLATDFQRLGLEHRITLTARFDPEDVPDWDTFDVWWGPFLTGSAPLRLPGARMTAVGYVGPATPERLADFLAQTEARGLLPLSFYAVADEPPWHSTYEEVRVRGGQVRQQLPRLRTMLTISSLYQMERERLTDLIDIAVVLVYYLDPSRGQYSRSDAFLGPPNRELWLYQTCGSHACGGVLPENFPGHGWPSYMVDVPATKARALEWVSFQEGATGELYYEVAQKLTSAWTDQYSYGGNGDGTLFYPGTVSVIGGTQGVPLPSMRLKLIRLGMQDYEWLKRVKDLGDQAFAQDVARELIPVPWRVTDEGEAFERARVRLIQRALTLAGARVPESVEAYLRAIPEPPERNLIQPVRMGVEW